MQLPFLQSNWLRQYPFKSTSGITDLNGLSLPKDLIVGLRISVAAADVDVYISKIVINNGVVGVEFMSSNGFLGSAAGSMTQDNQSLKIIAENLGSIGVVIIGNSTSTNTQAAFHFDYNTGVVEPSTVTLISKPGLSSITIKGQKLTGLLGLASNSISITGAETLQLALLSPQDVTSRGDKQAKYLTCDNAVIGGINTVLPDINGNIDIYAIAPLTIATSGISGVSALKLTSAPITRQDLCIPYNIPPADQNSTESNTLEEATATEFSGWPQFS